MKKNRMRILFAVSAVAFLTGCGAKPSGSIDQPEESSIIDKSEFEILSEALDTQPSSISLETPEGLKVRFGNKGAKIDSVDWDGKHLAENGFTAGRVANRIANATFTLNGETYNTNKNNGKHTLHGGSQGFGERNWTITALSENSVTYYLHSNDGDMGFPGALDMTTTYTLEDDGTLTFEYRAVCDSDTIFNPINHLYMNMNGNTSNKNHDLWIDAEEYTKANSELIPTGEIVSVEGTTLDYREKNQYHGNNDSNLCLNGEGYRKVAEMDGLTGGYRVELFTDRIGLQLYSDGKFICLEAQDYPDAINHEEFPSIVLEAGEEYYSKSAYKFSKIA